MKILFICGALEPGRDGVGDYTRLLAQSLFDQQHDVAVLAFADAYVTELSDNRQPMTPPALRFLRLPADWPVKTRLAMAKRWIGEVDPDWISLQYVPYTYHPKGLSFRIGRQLQQLGQGRNWHIMFHELWVGIARQASPSLLATGLVQRYLVRRLIGRLSPRVIHTQTTLYQALLARLGVKATYLPLFSNIPVTCSIPAGVDESSDRAGHDIELIIFGGIHANAPVDALAREAAIYAQTTRRSVSLRLIGRMGDEQARWLDAFQAAGLSATVLGELPPDQISGYLSRAGLGVSTTALAVIEKSGALAAMRAHGLPILCVAPAWDPREVGIPVPPADVLMYEPGNLAACFDAAQPTANYRDVDAVARQLVLDLNVLS